MFWRLVYQFKGLNGLNEAIESKSIENAISFLKVYLSKPFDNDAYEPFKIFDFLDDFVVEEKDYELCEKIMIGSKYFETMPLERVVEALYHFIFVADWNMNTEKFSKYLIGKIRNSQILLDDSLDNISDLCECYFGLGFEDKILELGVDYIIRLSKELEYSDSKELLAFCKEHLSLEEMEKLCKNGDFAVPDIIDAMLQSYDDLEFNMLINIILDKKEREYSIIDIKRRRKITVFEEFLDEINRRDEITVQHKDYLALKLLESKNYPRMIDWLANVDCEENKKLIDELVGKVTEFIILYSISNKYISYAVSKLLEQGEVNSMGINTLDALFLGQYDNEKLECILNGLCIINPNIKFSKKTTMYLLKLGVSRFAALINEYELTEEERLDILKALKEINSDWLIIYGAYLVSGDGFTKMLDYVADEQMRRIRDLKSSSE